MKEGYDIDGQFGPFLEILVTDDTSHEVTSKRKKMDEKITHFAVHVPPSLFGISKK